MSRGDLERLSKDELIELVLKLQRPAKTSRTSSRPPSTDRKERREQSRPHHRRHAPGRRPGPAGPHRPDRRPGAGRAVCRRRPRARRGSPVKRPRYLLTLDGIGLAKPSTTRRKVRAAGFDGLATGCALVRAIVVS